MNVLCIGGAGYIGSACVRHLHATRGIEVRALDNLSKGNKRSVPYDRLLVHDLYDRSELRNLIRHFKIDTVMHFAAHADVGQSVQHPEMYYGLNVGGMKALLDTLIQTDCRKIIFSSSCAVYGNCRTITGAVSEDQPLDPCSPYGRSKVICEWMLEDYRKTYGLGYTSLRYFNAAGAHLDGSHGEWRKRQIRLIPLIFNALLNDRVFKIFGNDYATPDGTCIRDYIHIGDLAAAHRLAAENLTECQGNVYNLGSGKGYSILEVIRACEAVSNRTLLYDVVDRRPGDPEQLFANFKKAKEELEWEPQLELPKIVETAWRWHKNYPETY